MFTNHKCPEKYCKKNRQNRPFLGTLKKEDRFVLWRLNYDGDLFGTTTLNKTVRENA